MTPRDNSFICARCRQRHEIGETAIVVTDESVIAELRRFKRHESRMVLVDAQCAEEFQIPGQPLGDYYASLYINENTLRLDD